MSDYFPTELMIEILLRLPVESLIRFTTVCRSWYSLITKPSFISSHLSNAKKHALLRRYDNHDKREHYSLLQVTGNGPFGVNSSSELDFPFKSQFGHFRIVGSCNGLVCLSDDLFATASLPVVIWNPSVRNHVVLPMPTINPEEPHSFVLGFGAAGHDVKVVRLVYCRKTDDLGFRVAPQVETYSLKTASWRRLRGVDLRLQILEFMWHQAFMNGVVHWLAYELINNNSFRSSILAFEVGSEVFHEVMLPSELARETVTNLCISLISESLGVTKYGKEAASKWADVWVMKEYGVKATWTKLYRIDMLDGIEKVVSFRENGEALVALQGFELVAYDSETRQMKELGICGATRSFYVASYVESLLLLRGHSGGTREDLNEGALEDLSLHRCFISVDEKN